MVRPTYIVVVNVLPWKTARKRRTRSTRVYSSDKNSRPFEKMKNIEHKIYIHIRTVKYSKNKLNYIRNEMINYNFLDHNHDL